MRISPEEDIWNPVSVLLGRFQILSEKNNYSIINYFFKLIFLNYLIINVNTEIRKIWCRPTVDARPAYLDIDLGLDVRPAYLDIELRMPR